MDCDSDLTDGFARLRPGHGGSSQNPEGGGRIRLHFFKSVRIGSARPRTAAVIQQTDSLRCGEATAGQTVHRTVCLDRPFESVRNDKKSNTIRCWTFCGGGGRIRTIEAKRSRFTVCPLWPLGNSPIFTLHSSVEPVDGLGQSRSGSQELTGNAHSRCILIFESVRMKIGGAGRRTRTPDLLITNQWLYQLSYTGERTERNHYTTQF